MWHARAAACVRRHGAPPVGRPLGSTGRAGAMDSGGGVRAARWGAPGGTAAGHHGPRWGRVLGGRDARGVAATGCERHWSTPELAAGQRGRGAERQTAWCALGAGGSAGCVRGRGGRLAAAKGAGGVCCTLQAGGLLLRLAVQQGGRLACGLAAQQGLTARCGRERGQAGGRTLKGRTLWVLWCRPRGGTPAHGPG